MKFCPKCGSILTNKEDKYICLNCGYNEEIEKKELNKFSEEKKMKDKITVFEEIEGKSLPIDTEVECPKCGNKGAYFWTMQTRASDESETKFYRCIKCNYTWRIYD